MMTMMAEGIRRKKEEGASERERVGMWKIVFDGGCDDAKSKKREV